MTNIKLNSDKTYHTPVTRGVSSFFKYFAIVFFVILMSLGFWLTKHYYSEKEYIAAVERYQNDISDDSFSWCTENGDVRFQVKEKTPNHTLYSGEAVLHGEISIESGNLVFRPAKLEGPCAHSGFKIVNDLYDGDIGQIGDQLGLVNVLKRKPKCSDGEAWARGFFALDVRGYALSNAYIDKYDPRRSLSSFELSSYRFDIAVNSVKEVYVPLYWTCPFVTPPRPYSL